MIQTVWSRAARARSARAQRAHTTAFLRQSCDFLRQSCGFLVCVCGSTAVESWGTAVKSDKGVDSTDASKKWQKCIFYGSECRKKLERWIFYGSQCRRKTEGAPRTAVKNQGTAVKNRPPRTAVENEQCWFFTAVPAFSTGSNAVENNSTGILP